MSPDKSLLVLRRELAGNCKSFLLWTVPVAALVALTVSLQPGFAKQGSLLMAKFAAMPEGMRTAFGIGVLDLTRAPGYLATNFIYVTLTGSLLAGSFGAALLSREESMRTAELLLVQPVSRLQVVLGKAAAALLYALAFQAVICTVAIISSHLVIAGDIEAPMIIALFAGTSAMAVCFAGLGLLAAAVSRKARSAPGLALGIVFGSYLIGVVSALKENARGLKLLSPYKWVDPTEIVQHGGVNLTAAVLLVGIGFAAIAAATVIYSRKDIHA